ncbi:MAG: aminotransferase class I/II-fold pyridoxal phosphate-dependent enzyme [Clostridiales bacterium]|jgi:histidinol-phosphate aminotransferase|nr:aminotransferase class I/II-fold pyridoxal phosphate-dependent enzyme [Clostridiales bacterium]
MKFSKLLPTLKPYVAGEQPKDRSYIKLNTNENPYPPSPLVKKAIRDFDADSLRLYPDPDASELKAALAKKHGVSSGNIFVGNGSDEVLGFCFPAFFDRRDCRSADGADGQSASDGERRLAAVADKTPPILFPDVTYSFYPVYANMYEIPYERVPLRDDYTVDIGGYSGRPRQGVIIANPNAPTGIALEIARIEELIAANSDALVLIDEAYADFWGYSAVPLVAKYQNLLVVRTFSKSYSLAGIRCGYAVGQKPLIAALETVKNSFNSYTLDAVTQKAALAACADGEYYDMINERVVNVRDALSLELRQNGFTVLKSDANFIFVKKDGFSGLELFSALRDKGVLVRHFAGERTGDFIRVTVGTSADCRVFADEIIGLTKK